jgi:hypothetical protein
VHFIDKRFCAKMSNLGLAYYHVGISVIMFSFTLKEVREREKKAHGSSSGSFIF